MGPKSGNRVSENNLLTPQQHPATIIIDGRNETAKRRPKMIKAWLFVFALMITPMMLGVVNLLDNIPTP